MRPAGDEGTDQGVPGNDASGNDASGNRVSGNRVVGGVPEASASAPDPAATDPATTDPAASPTGGAHRLPEHIELDPDPDLGPRERTWTHVTEWPLIIASVVFLVAYAVRVLFEPQLGRRGHDACEGVQWGMWALFALDYVVRLVLAQRRARWFGRHLFDLAVIALPMMRPLRLLRLVALLQVMNRRATIGLRGRVVAYLAGGSLLLWFVASLAVLDAERLAPGANIRTFGQAAWWALATMTTVGYGDAFPVSVTGRVVAACLMVGGIALLGTVTATLASWLADRVRDEDVSMTEVLTELHQVRRELADLRRELADQQGPASAPDTHRHGG